MGWRHSELMAFGPKVVRFERSDALATYQCAMRFCSRTRYGLDERIFAAIERLDVNEPGLAALEWLAKRVGEVDLLLVFGQEDVFQVPAQLFLEHWQDMFCPSRDDVVIMPTGGGWALFYCHEEEFEYARVDQIASRSSSSQRA